MATEPAGSQILTSSPFSIHKIHIPYITSHHNIAISTNMADIASYIPFAKKACDFFTNSPDPYHSVENNVQKLRAAGYVQLSKREAFAGKLKPGGKYYYTFNKTTLVAFSVGKMYQPGNGFKIIGGTISSTALVVFM